MNLRIKDLREDNDLTQREIAEYLHCDQSLYSKYERGERDIPVRLLVQFAKYYNTSTDYLLGLSEKNKVEVKEMSLKDSVIDKLIDIVLEITLNKKNR